MKRTIGLVGLILFVAGGGHALGLWSVTGGGWLAIAGLVVLIISVAMQGPAVRRH